MKKLLNFLLVFILIGTIVGGLGFIGYSFLFGKHASGHNAMISKFFAQIQTGKSDSSANSNQQNMQHGNMNNGSTVQSETTTETSYELQNKEKLNKAYTLIDEAVKLITNDPFVTNDTTNIQNQQDSNSKNGSTQENKQSGTQSSNPSDTNTQSSTTVNVYPQGAASQANIMPNMGATYDPNKMEQLHSGLYKMTVGMSLFEQLLSNIDNQTQITSMQDKNSMKYSLDQYNLAIQNKNKLNQILNYVNEASNLINVNPYISNNGVLYDKERMKKIHESIGKLAQGNVLLNELSDDFTKQAIYYGQKYQNQLSNQQVNAMNQGTSGVSGNFNISSIVNIILGFFIILFMISIFGVVSSLFKTSNSKSEKI